MNDLVIAPRRRWEYPKYVRWLWRTEGKTPQKAKGQQLAGGEGLSLAVVQFGQA